jgi:hypothetical protein
MRIVSLLSKMANALESQTEEKNPHLVVARPYESWKMLRKVFTLPLSSFVLLYDPGVSESTLKGG